MVVEDEIPDQDVDLIRLGYETEFQRKLLFAHYLLKLETCQRLTGTAVNIVSEHTQYLLLENSKQHCHNFCQWLKDQEIQFNINDINQIVSNVDLSEFNSICRRNSFYARNCGLVEPKPVFLGTTMKQIRGRVFTLQNYGYIVPMKETLKSFLCLPEVAHYIANPHTNSTQLKDVYCNKIIVIHRITQRLKPIWVYLPHGILALITL